MKIQNNEIEVPSEGTEIQLQEECEPHLVSSRKPSRELLLSKVSSFQDLLKSSVEGPGRRLQELESMTVIQESWA